ncbi:AAA family ATPase [Thermosipho ferrireducens]|uniref:DNA repair protein RecN n=1 Tax=Thermosipho ferrireducens TaxID=2571116 RepID=A0ABX7S898_9BACT|nr:AAA family ATPase [Thermosipho ferrireducens]QTA38020.1 AAA family ATPase [Thermosipho ferrireducens]
MKTAEIFSLHLHDYLYFKDVDVYFSSGLNVFTGETGAGKSLLLDVIGILLGYGNTKIDNYSAEIVIHLPESYPDYEIVEGENVFSVLRKNGRTTFKINGKVFPKNIVSKVLGNHISIHRQNSHIKFLEPNFLLGVLDQIGDNKTLLRDFRKRYEEYKKIQEILNSENLEILEKRKEDLEYQINEIEAVKPDLQEEYELNEKYQSALNFQQLLANFNEALETGQKINEYLWNLKKILPEKYTSFLDTALDVVVTLNLEIEKELSDIEELDITQIEERIWAYNNLKRKYGPTLEDVLENYSNMKKEYENIMERIEVLRNSESKLMSLEKELKDLGKKLTEKRKKASEKILKKFRNHLKDLSMTAKVDFIFKSIEMTGHGFDKVELVGQTVKSQKMQPLRSIASGGELSRIMLALELSIASGGVLIFDEVDTGIGGETGNKLAEKLKEVSENYQVIVVTHLPQVAVRANKHFAVIRNEDSGEIKELDEKERKTEIKRMLGSEDVLNHI